MSSILYLIDHDNLGGAQRIVEGIVQNSEGILVYPLRTKKTKDSQVFFPEEKCFLPPARNGFSYFFNILKLPFIIKHSGIKIVHCQLLASWICGLWISLFFTKKNRPIIIFHEHSSITLPYLFQKVLLHFANRQGKLMSVSDSIRKDMAGYGVQEEDIMVLKNFIDLEKFSPHPIGKEDQLHLGIDPEWIKGRKVAGSAIRLVGYKGWRTLIEAAKLLSQEPLCFLISGDGEDRQIVQDMIIENHLENTVKLIGMQKDMPVFYNSLDLFLFPSLKESFGIVLIEAQACGIPVISMDLPALREVAENDSAVLVAPGDIKTFVSEILSLMNNTSYGQRLKEKGLENVKNYSLQHYLNKLEEIYRQLLQDPEINLKKKN